MAKPKYITDLETKVEKLETAQKELREGQDDMIVAQGDILRNQNGFSTQLTTIHDALLGNEFTEDLNGGLIKKVGVLCNEVTILKNWKERVVITTSLLYAFFAGLIAFLGTVIIKNWDKIFGG